MFVIDANKEELAIKEANVLGIPGRRDPRFERLARWHRVPGSGNDDASRAIRLYCEAIATARQPAVAAQEASWRRHRGARCAASRRRGRASAEVASRFRHAPRRPSKQPMDGNCRPRVSLRGPVTARLNRQKGANQWLITAPLT
jgi:hypothetical protein